MVLDNRGIMSVQRYLLSCGESAQAWIAEDCLDFPMRSEFKLIFKNGFEIIDIVEIID